MHDAASTVKEAAEKIFATAGINIDLELNSLDPAERLEFSRPPKKGIIRFDARTDQQLIETAKDHLSSMERERAVWEFADRNKTQALTLLEDVAKNDPLPSVRWSTLWAIQKFGDNHALDLISKSLKDKHPEVRDWAQLLIREITGVISKDPEVRKTRYDESNPFDQTLPLTIAGYARVLVPQMGWVQATLSPQWFESIMGRVMACTNETTFETDLVIEKRIYGYHPDQTDHFEIYKFNGFSQELSPNICYHQYISEAQHTFYPSGKVEDASITPLNDVKCGVQRIAITNRINDPIDSSKKIVHSVRGRYMGPAYINLQRVMSNGMQIGAGEVQLSNFYHPIVGKMTNTFLFGTFKGKLSDLDEDGYLDVNTERCHGTLNGELDSDLDGKVGNDPFDYYQ